MSAPTETPPATTATEPEVAKDAKDATLTVDVAAAVDKGDTEQQPPESPEVVTPGGTILAKVPEPEEGLVSCGVGPYHPNADAVRRDKEKREREDAEAAGDKKDTDAPKEAEEPPAKKAALEEEALKEAPKEAETTLMPPPVTRQTTTLSPEADAAVPPPALQREATVAA